MPTAAARRSTGSFTLAKDGTVVAGVPTRQVGFQLASYDRNKTLFIDPAVNTIPYSTYFGGNGSSIGPLNLEQFASFLGDANLIDSETGVDVALDPSANAYITGTAYSNDLPAAGFFQSTLKRRQFAAVAKSKRLRRKVRHQPQQWQRRWFTRPTWALTAIRSPAPSAPETATWDSASQSTVPETPT